MTFVTEGRPRTDAETQKVLGLISRLLGGIQTDSSLTDQAVKDLTRVLENGSRDEDPAFRAYVHGIHTYASRLCCVQALLRRRVWDDCQEGRLQATYRELRAWLVAQIPETATRLHQCATATDATDDVQ